MKKITLILFALSTLSCFGQKDSIVKSEIRLVTISDKDLNVIFESRKYKFYFNRRDLIKYIESTNIYCNDDTLDTKSISNDLKSNYKTRHYVDVEWYLKLKAKKYNYLEQKDGITDESRSDIYIINHNQYLLKSSDFESILFSYLQTGKFRIYDKKGKAFISPRFIKLEHIITSYKNGQSDKFIFKLNSKQQLFEYKYGYFVMD